MKSVGKPCWNLHKQESERFHTEVILNFYMEQYVERILKSVIYHTITKSKTQQRVQNIKILIINFVQKFVLSKANQKENKTQ